MARLTVNFLRPTRTGSGFWSIVGASIGIARAGEPHVVGWRRTDGQGRVAYDVADAGPWSLRTSVRGALVGVPIGYVQRNTAIDLVVYDTGVVTAYYAGTTRRVRFA